MYEYARQRGLRRVMIRVPVADTEAVEPVARFCDTGVCAHWTKTHR